MQRRDVLKVGGAAVATLATASGAASARKEGDAPNGNVQTTGVSVFNTREDPTLVPAGSWIEHRIAWLDAEGGDSTRADVERWLDSVVFEASIDGERVEDTENYWGEAHQENFGGETVWIVRWQYYTPPKKPGVYEFTITQSYPEGFYDSGVEVRKPGQTNTFTGYYEVQSDGNGR